MTNNDIKCQEIIDLRDGYTKINWEKYKSITKYLKNKHDKGESLSSIENNAYEIYKDRKYYADRIRKNATTIEHLKRLEILVNGRPHNFTENQIKETLYHGTGDYSFYDNKFNKLKAEYYKKLHSNEINSVITKIKPLIGDKPIINARCCHHNHDRVSVTLIHSILNEDTILREHMELDLQGNVQHHSLNRLKFWGTDVIPLIHGDCHEDRLEGYIKDEYLEFYENLALRSQE